MNQFLDRFPVVNRLLALLQGYECFLPRRFASFETSAARHLAHVLRGPHLVNLYLEDCFDRILNLRFGRAAIDAERQKLAPILRLFLRHQRLFSDYRRLDDFPNGSHFYAAAPLFPGMRRGDRPSPSCGRARWSSPSSFARGLKISVSSSTVFGVSTSF